LTLDTSETFVLEVGIIAKAFDVTVITSSSKYKLSVPRKI